MSLSELVTPQHLARKAVIYVRQSSPHQVLNNQESLRLQYALRRRATDLGWHADDVEVIDSDLGLTGSVACNREGFKELTARVTLGQVGIILSSEVTRLSRNCSDWYPLLDVCGYKRCLIADHDGVYDPATINGRLVLGLKGTLSEMELHTIRGRMTAGLLNKAERGELALMLPTGLVRDEAGIVHKDPNVEIQDRIGLVFETFLRVRTASKALHFFNEGDLLLPRRDRFGDVAWKKPTISAILSILKNPAYGGAFVYGKTSHGTIHGPEGTVTKLAKRLPMDEWKIRVNDKYPAYVEWETFEGIQQMLKDNHAEYAIATGPVASPGRARRCCTGSSTAVSAGTRWSCSIREGPVTCATTCASSTACRSASTSRPIRSMPWSLRCLIEKVVVHRAAPDLLRTRVVWKGGEVTTFEIPVTVGSFTDLSGAEEMERLTLELFHEGKSDEEIARHLSDLGHRSPRSSLPQVLTSTVKALRLRHGLFREQHQSHPRSVAGQLTISQVARKLEVSNHWVYDRIYNGRIRIAKDAATGLYLFPDEPATIEKFRELKERKVHNLRF